MRLNLSLKKYNVSRPHFLLIGILFKLVLEISYIFYVHPNFSYSGFNLDISPIKYIEGWFFYIFLLNIFPYKLNKPSDYFLVYTLFSYICPLLIFYSLSNAARFPLYTVLATLVLIFLFCRGYPIKMGVFKNGPKLAFFILLFGSSTVTAWMLASGGFNYFNLDLSLVYEFRDDVAAVINEGPMGYINTWATKVFGPALLVFFLWNHKYLFASCIVMLHIIWFGISAHKAVLFYPFLVFFIWAWYKNKKSLSFIPLIMLFVVLFSFFAFLIFDDIIIGSLFIRRTFFVPSQLTFLYYDFFTQNHFVYWSNSIGSYFNEYSYLVSTPELIGQYMNTNSRANNSFFATGYMHAGLFGMVFYAIFVGILFRVIDSICYKKVPTWVATSILIVPIQALLISSDLPAAMLTHGIIPAIFILFLFRTNKIAQ
jgi:hypothetical protein